MYDNWDNNHIAIVFGKRTTNESTSIAACNNWSCGFGWLCPHTFVSSSYFLRPILAETITVSGATEGERERETTQNTHNMHALLFETRNGFWIKLLISMYGSGGSRCCLTIVTIAMRLLNCYVSATVAAVAANVVSFARWMGWMGATGAEQKEQKRETNPHRKYR